MLSYQEEESKYLYLFQEDLFQFDYGEKKSSMPSSSLIKKKGHRIYIYFKESTFKLIMKGKNERYRHVIIPKRKSIPGVPKKCNGFNKYYHELFQINN